MNKFDILLNLLAKVQDDHIGTTIDDIGGYGDRAFVNLKLQNGSELKIDVAYKEPEEPVKEES